MIAGSHGQRAQRCQCVSVRSAFLGTSDAEDLAVPMVPLSEFLDRLWASARASGGGSAHALRFAGLVESYNLTPTEVTLCIERAVKISPALSAVEPVGRADVQKWLSFWEEIGFLASSTASSKL